MAARVAFIFTHRIQYFTNLLDELCKRGKVEPLVIYGRETSTIDDPGFDRRISWDNRPETKFREVILRGFGLTRRLSSFSPDIIHLNGYGDIRQWRAWFWARWHRVPIFVRGDGDTLSKRKTVFPGFKQKLAQLFTRQARVVFFQGEENRKFWIEKGARSEQLRWLPCVSDTQIFKKPAFASREERLKFRDLHGADANAVVFLVSGKLIARKRPADAIRALAKLQNKQTRLWFLGSGPLEEDLKLLTKELDLTDRIRFLGFQNQTQLPAIIQSADVLVHAAEYDPWPYAILEAAHAGLALVISDCTGSCADWIDAHQAGLRFRCGDLSSLETA